MTRRRALAVLSAAFALTAFPLAAETAAVGAIFIVRHAEKQADANAKDVPLSPAGQARAERLARPLRDARIVAVYSTDTVRTRSTASPLARTAEIEVTIYDPADAGGQIDLKPLAERIRREHRTGNVLVVGHSNTVAPLIRALGSTEEVAIGDQDFDGLYVVVPSGEGASPVLLRLRT